jgi:hypothetical protein
MQRGDGSPLFLNDMMPQDKLTESNFVFFAMRNYDNPQCHSMEEFDEDLKKILYLKKLLTRYKKDGELRERLILNHIIILYNLFGQAATRMLFFKIDKENWDVLVTFLLYLGHMPDTLPEFDIILSDIKLDETIISVLRKI